MAFYSYFCQKNGKTIEVWHAMNKRLKTWEDVCQCAKIKIGDTPSQAPVVRLIGGAPAVWKVKGLDKDDYGKELRV